MKCLIVVFLKLARLKVSYDLSQLLPSVSTDIATSLKMLLKRTALESSLESPWSFFVVNRLMNLRICFMSSQNNCPCRGLSSFWYFLLMQRLSFLAGPGKGRICLNCAHLSFLSLQNSLLHNLIQNLAIHVCVQMLHHYSLSWTLDQIEEVLYPESKCVRLG